MKREEKSNQLNQKPEVTIEALRESGWQEYEVLHEGFLEGEGVSFQTGKRRGIRGSLGDSESHS